MRCGEVPHLSFRAISAAPWPLEPARKDIMTRRFATILVVVLATVALQAGPHAASLAPSTAADSSFEEPVAKGTESGETVGFWNLIGITTILATPLGPRAAPLGSRAMAMMHVAMADAVASIHPTHKPYAVRVTGHRGSDKVAAAASAAYGVLVRLFPTSHCNSTLRSPSRSRRFRTGRKKTEASPWATKWRRRLWRSARTMGQVQA